MTAQPTLPLNDPARLEALRQTELLDAPIEAAFERMTKLASRILHAPVALVSLVDSDRQFFVSSVGLPEPWAAQRQTPLSHSFCQHVVQSAAPLVVEDARLHPLVQQNLAIPDLGVVSYAGMPMTTANEQTLGSFCVIDTQPRQWTEDELYVLHELAESVMTEINLRSEIRARKQEQAAREQLQNDIIRMQAQTLAALSAPLIPISDDTLVLPLIGAFDADRAQHVVDVLLHGVAARRTRFAIIDITGVSLVDGYVATTLIRAAQAVRLLGAQVMLTGISPEIAQTLVGLGLDARGITTYSTLQQGIRGTQSTTIPVGTANNGAQAAPMLRGALPRR